MIVAEGDAVTSPYQLGSLGRAKPDVPPGCEMTRNWSVTVECEGQTVLTISSQHIGGLPDLDPWASTIRGCAQHLLGFIGQPGSGDDERVVPEADFLRVSRALASMLGVLHRDGFQFDKNAPLDTEVERWIAERAARQARGDAALFQQQLPTSLRQGDATAPANVDELITPAALGTDEVDTEAVNAGLNGIKGDVRKAADANPHSYLPAINVEFHDSPTPVHLQGDARAQSLDGYSVASQSGVSCSQLLAMHGARDARRDGEGQ